MSGGRPRRDGTEIVAGHEPRARTKHRVKRRSWWKKRSFWIPALGVFLALFAVSAVRYYLAASALSDGRTQVLAARQVLAGDFTKLDAAHVSEAQADLQRASADFGGNSQLLQDGWLVQAAAHLPWLSGQVEGIQALRRAGASGVQLGVDVVGLFRDIVPGADSTTSSPLQRLVALADKHPEQLKAAADDLTAFSKSLAAVPQFHLFGPFEAARQTVLTEGGKITAGAGPALQILQAIPAAIGIGSHSYLVLLNNPGEEMPGGGYIGAVGEVTFTDGAISALTFRGSEYYDGLVKSVPAPPALALHLFGTRPWDLANANWSADFPTAMADVERLYTLGTGKKVEGVISVDPVALGYVLAVLGPVHVPPYPQVLTASNVLTELNYITNKARPQDPGKVYLPPFGALVTRELFQAPVSQMPRLAQALQRAAHEKHVVPWFHDQTLQSLVDGAGFGGRLTTPTSDSVLVADANLSGTKGDLFVTRSMHLDVKVQPNGNATDRLTLTYANPKLTNPADLALLPQGGGQYRDYVRVYLPETVQITGMTAGSNGAAPVPVAPESTTYEFGRLAVAYWFIVPVGETYQLTFTYSGPLADISVTPERYGLTWIKQVNALPWPVDVTVTMPGGRSSHWASSLSTDLSWAVAG
jgi:hypothetical protein